MFFKSPRGTSHRAAILIGMVCLSISILIQRFLPETSLLDFTSGILTGMSISMMLWGMWRFRIERVKANR